MTLHGTLGIYQWKIPATPQNASCPNPIFVFTANPKTKSTRNDNTESELHVDFHDFGWRVILESKRSGPTTPNYPNRNAQVKIDLAESQLADDSLEPKWLGNLNSLVDSHKLYRPDPMCPKELNQHIIVRNVCQFENQDPDTRATNHQSRDFLDASTSA